MPRIQWIGLALLSLSFSSITGCVSLDKYKAMQMDRDRYAVAATQAESEAKAARAEAELLKQQLAALGANAGNSTALITGYNTQIADLTRQLAELNQRYREAMDRIGQGGTGPLPTALSNELEEFARQNPDLVEFDRARGVVKFKSDVTFATGSAVLTDKAKSVIQRFATILNSPVASNYELIVAGHTDNTPVVNPETKRQGHKDNWYLSAHRAISVGEELQQNSVHGKRLGVTGYADYHPVASNDSESGKAKNRRVEVLILPTTAGIASAPVAPRTGSARPAPKALNKDTVAPAPRPVLNK